MHLDNAKIALMHLLDQLLSNGLDARFAKGNPKFPHSLTLLTLGWLFPMLDYVMTGDERVGRVHKKFLNEVLANGLTVRELNDADKALRASGAAFDPKLPPAFLLIAERLQPGFCLSIYRCLDSLIEAAIAWDGERTPNDIARAEEVLRPIRKHFRLPEVAPAPPAAKTVVSGNGLQELESLIGLHSVKEEVRNGVNLARYLLNRRNNDLPVAATSLHMVFTGNPGTGKTTVARLIADIYRDIGLLRKGHLVEADRSKLVAQYLGQTPIQVAEVVESALGGVLFIDEAYSLVVNRDSEDYGFEAVDTLLKLMEDHRDDLVVIVAGYTDEMQQFIQANPGLKSRFTRYIHFDDYNAADLQQIFQRLCEKHEFNLSTEAQATSQQAIEQLWQQRGENFGNAREVRTLFERVMQLHANRLSQVENPDRAALSMLTIEDIPQ
ncbi:AAA family ATPase [Pseudomonas sp. GWSMS-1]|uniref:AAA family ATPase n=1 Tax=Pseudomonas sp. GWSMS-1 TaxID=3308997 RepID=UPI003CEBE4EE